MGQILDRFAPADARLLASRALQKRIDTKFLLSRRELDALLNQVVGGYAVALAGGIALASYETRYFDTPDLRCYHDDRAGRIPSHKLRVRHYEERGSTYLELKTRHPGSVTTKRRRRVEVGMFELDDASRGFVRAHCDLPVERLQPMLWTNFRRLTLVGIGTHERVTIDVDVEYVGETTVALGDVVIAEVKQRSFSDRTPLMRALAGLGLQPVSTSKYCTATLLTRPSVVGRQRSRL